MEPKNEKDLYKKLSDENVGGPEKDKILKLLRLNNFSQEIDLLAYCLMPNHFHFLVLQRTANGIDRFCNSLFTRYATYFNKKYLRVGRLFQDVYKAVLVDSEAYLLHLSRYIHRNPLELDDKIRRKHQETYSSLPEYLETRKTQWVKPELVLAYFSKKEADSFYEDFVEEDDDLELIKPYTIDET